MKKFSSTMRSYVVLTLVFLILTIILPANMAARKDYNLSALQYHILLFVVVLPLIAIWFTAFYGYARLKIYADKISNTKEGDDFQQIARGLKWLVWGFPIPSIISIILSSIANSNPGFKTADVIINSYIALLIPLVAFSILSSGTRGLADHARLRVSSTAIKVIMAIFVILGVMYCFLTFRQLNLRDAFSANNPFYLPVWILIVTLTIPYLYAWLAGLMSAYNIALYGRRAHGILYRRPTRILAVGVGLVTLGSIALQYVTSVTSRNGHLSLDSLLLLTYAIRLVAGAGYILITVGAIRLHKIEEV